MIVENKSIASTILNRMDDRYIEKTIKLNPKEPRV